MNKKIIKPIIAEIAIIITAFTSVSVVTASATSTTKNQLKSKGVIEITDEETESVTIIDSSDLEMLADSIDKINDSMSFTTNLDKNRVLITDNNNEIVSSTITTEELSHLSGLNKNVQESLLDLGSRITAFQSGIIKMYDKVDLLDGVADNMLGTHKMNKSFEGISDALFSNGDLGIIRVAAGDTYVIPEGYTLGGNVIVDSLNSQTPGTADAASILSGKDCWVNGQKIEGSMNNNSNTTISSNIVNKSNDSYSYIKIPQNGYYSTNSIIKVDNNSLVNSNINLSFDSIIRAVNNRGGNLKSDATNVEIANAIKELNITTLVSGNVNYTYHHHTTTNESMDDHSTATGKYSNNYNAQTSGGCFTNKVTKYHYHTDNCYRYEEHRGTFGAHYEGEDPNWVGADYTFYYCGTCKQHVTREEATKRCHTAKILNCSKAEGSVESVSYSRSCGKSDGEITKAEIIY